VTRRTSSRHGRQVGLGRVEAEAAADVRVEALRVEGERDLVDGRHVHALDHRAEIDVAEERDLALHLLRQRPLGAADEEVGLDADLHQLAHGVLRGLRLDLVRGRDVRHQGEVHEDGVRLPHLLPELADRLQERLRLDVADRAAHLHEHHVVAGRDALDGALDLVGDVRDDLDRGAQVLPAPLLADDVQVDAAGRDVVGLGERAVDEALVVPEVEVGLGAVVGDEHLAVLERRHGARVDVQVRVELERRDREPALDEQPASDAAAIPLPSDETTPPVTNTYFVGRLGSGRGAHAGGWREREAASASCVGAGGVAGTA
jgi:hypothetical protein